MSGSLKEVLPVDIKVVTFCKSYCGRLLSVVAASLLLTIGGWLPSQVVQAAEISDDEFNQLLETTKQRGYAAVSIEIVRLTWERLIDPVGTKATVQPKIEALAKELSSNVLPASYWEIGLAKVGVHVNEQGLQILKASQNVFNFSADSRYKTHNKSYVTSGGQQAAEDKLVTASTVDVEMIFNTPVEYDLDGKTGEPVVKPSAQLNEQLLQAQKALFNKPFAADITNLTLVYGKAMMRAQVNRNAFLGLVLSEEIRSIQLAGYVDPTKPEWPPEVLMEAQREGEIHVEIQLRLGPYIEWDLWNSEASTRATYAANERAFASIFADAGLSLVQLQRDGYSDANMPRYGSLSALLSLEALNKLYAVKDPRISSIQLPTLTIWDPTERLPDVVSTTTLNKPTAYCFTQTSVRGDYTKFIVDHHLLVDEAAIGKAGDVFVVAKFKDNPNAYWLSNGYYWRAYKRGAGRPEAYERFSELPPLISTKAFNNPANVEPNFEKGVILVGYGLRQLSGAAVDSFEEMLRSDRLKVVWEGNPHWGKEVIDIPQETLGTPSLCLDMRGIKQITPRYKNWYEGVVTQDRESVLAEP
jgi:hypothetical protein